MFDKYLLNFHKDDLIKILSDQDVTKHFSLNINFIVLYEHEAAIAAELFKTPAKCLEKWDNATLNAQLVLLREVEENAQLKNHVHCRIYQLPVMSEVFRTIFPGNNDAGKFLQISGTVMRASAPKLLEYQRNYVCIKCKYSMLVKAEYDRKYMIKQPRKCQNPEDCSGTNLITFGELDSDNCKDYQEIRLQEQVKTLGVGCMPNTMCVTLEDDLVDSCKPGDNVTIWGIVERRWGEFSKRSKIEIDIVLKANNVQVDNNSSSAVTATPEVNQMFDAFWEKYSKNPLTGRDLILKSFCPQLYGLYLVKLAVAVVLAGGSRVEDTMSTGVRTRSESHLLLVGDPGTGKSQLLRFASKIIPRSVLTTGVGSTAAGLTVTAMMEHGEWHLEGGALVLSDGGICCIDEFNSMKEHDRTSIHEAMEQQTISVAKASMVCKLNTRCSVLAACNPKGNLDAGQSLSMNIALPSPLLSRFDLILVLRDTVNAEWDTQIVDYILNSGNKYSKLTETPLWNTDLLQSYFAVVRKLNPKLSEDAEMILSAYYQMQRRIDGRNKARTTVRLLESLVRLSQGHARLMYHKTVETMDSIYAIILVDAAMENESSILDLNMTTYSVFPEHPVRDYRRMLESVLTKLGLLRILDKEIVKLNKAQDNERGNNVKSRFFNWPKPVDDESSGLFEELGFAADKSDKNLDDVVDFGESSEHLNRDRCQNSFIAAVQSSDTSLANSSKNKGKRRINGSNSEAQIVKKSKRVEADDIETSSSALAHEILLGDVNANRKNVASENTCKRYVNDTTVAGSSELKIHKSAKGNKKSDCTNSKEAKRSIISSQATRKLFDLDDIQLDLDLDEGYDTLSFGASRDAKTKKSVSKLSANEDKSQNISPPKSLNQAKRKNDLFEDRLTNINLCAQKTDISCQDKNRNIPFGDKEPVLENTMGASNIDVLKTKENASVDLQFKASTKYEIKTKTPIEETKNSSIKDKLKRFKFVRKDESPNKDEAISETLVIDKKTDEEPECSKENRVIKEIHESPNKSKVNKKIEMKKNTDAATCSQIKDSKRVQEKNTDNNFIRDDLEMLKLLPSFNDDLNIDLDFDWDNIDASKYNVPKQRRNKLSKKSSSMSRSSTSSSYQSSRKSIFQTSSENFDDLDLDI